ncbi:autotransporter domain-containing protein [Mesorhizobium sp. BAC0120]|uniref:autotransporter domain-containing protein n=1 Tax=Mesorhizobium sp. BAC0120 TaxID=3090670 RepID=UPI00298C5501|nr:autotransporter domain-containing protein [Mesorhizobium sp. BAC0120]MDW6022033.1 autotransporter domain-containing protein [Mesorhizobium sp. BAC0120]
MRTGARDSGSQTGVFSSLQSKRPVLRAGVSLLALGLCGITSAAFAADCSPSNIPACSAPSGVGARPTRNTAGGAGNGNGGNAGDVGPVEITETPGNPSSNGNGGDGATGGDSGGSTAAGGAGGAVGATGSAGVNASVTGGDGEDGDGNIPTARMGGGGGGGGAGVYINDAASTPSVGVGTVIKGGKGGNGGNSGDPAADAGGGGGGGSGIIVDATTVSIKNGGQVIGGAGGNGGSAGFAGNGGGGGDGVLVIGSGATIDNLAGGQILGGKGGNPGTPELPNGGNAATSGGGGAGVNLVSTGTLTNFGTIAGGATDGAILSTDSGLGAAAPGPGGAGVIAWSGGLVTNGGTIVGGRSGGVSAAGAGIVGTHLTINNAAVITGGQNSGAGTGGAGIIGDNLIIQNAGQISGGLGGGGGRANAITFTGGTNRLELQPGYGITGNVVASGTSTLALTGSSLSATFDASQLGSQYQGFTALEKNGSGKWTLTNQTSALTPWTIATGVLSISSDASLGDSAGALTFAPSGTIPVLEMTGTGASNRTIQLTGPGGIAAATGQTFTVNGLVTGTGELAINNLTGDEGKVVLGNAANNYSGGTRIVGGTLAISSDGNLGAAAGLVRLVDGTLETTANVSLNAQREIRIVNGDSTFQVDPLTQLTVDGLVSGSGHIAKTGTGTLVLNGANSYSGTTTVSAGTLIVGDDTHPGATLTGGVTVESGATLGGHGSVGTTTVSGGTLAPGASLGTLTVNGDLTIGDGSSLDFEFGAPGPNFSTPGQSDRIVVTGGLTIGHSTLNVTDMGSMGPGIYNLFKWGGSLSINNGGFAPPAGMSLQILTADKQINLINTQSLTLNLWNANGQASAGHMGGGTGTWSVFSNTWADTTGQFVGPMAPQPGFAIFGGEAGAVYVDDGDGAVSATGMQFMTDGYRLTGDTVSLVGTGGTAPVIRVSGGATATIESVIDGVNGFNKTDAGTLVLSAQNLYSGNTVLSGGELSVSSDGNLGQLANALQFEGGTLQVTGNGFHQTDRTVIWGNPGGGFDIADASNTFTVAQALTGSGGLLKIGAGTLTLSGNNNYSGGTTVGHGTLQLGDGAHKAAIVGSVTVRNDGTFRISNADTSAITTISNNDAGTVVFAGASSASDIHIINGPASAVLFVDDSDAGHATIDNNGVDPSAGNGTGFYDHSTAGHATITAQNALVDFSGDSSAGNATIIIGNGGRARIFGNASGGAAHFAINAGGTFDISGLAVAGTSVGSIEGAGGLFLGSKRLEVGGDNSSSEVSGVISDGGFAGGKGGSLVKSGSGMLTLTGANTYSGGTTVSGGTLVGSVASFGSGAILDNAALVLDQAANAAFGNDISGSGTLTKAGAGILAYDGNGSGFIGTTTISAGALIVGSDEAHKTAVLGGSMNVLSGTMLGGHGTVGSNAASVVTVENGATIAPGNSIGTLTIKGDLALAAGSRLEVEVDPAGAAADLVHVTGTATVHGGSVAHIGAVGSYRPSSTYAILTADGGLSGRFDSVVSEFAFLDPTLLYDARNVFLKLNRNDVAFADKALTRNQKAAAGSLDTFDPANPLYGAIVTFAEDDAMIRDSFDQLTGEVHASVKGTLIEDSALLRDAVNDRIRSAFGTVAATNVPVLAYGAEGGATPAIAAALAPADAGRLAAWGTAFGAWGDRDGDGNAAEISSATGGFLTGIDAPLSDTIRLGVVTGFSHTTFGVDERASSGDSTNWHFGLYGGGQWEGVMGGALGFRAGVAYSWHDISTVRSVAFAGFADRLSSDYDAGTAQAFGELAYDIKAGSIGLEPFANLAYVSLHTDGFTETGGAAALASRSSNTDDTFTTVGLRASADFSLGSVTATARGMLGWRHAFGDVTPEASLAFSGSAPFTIAGTPIAEDAAILQAGLDLNLSSKATLGLAYQGQLASKAQQNGFRASLEVRF